MNILKEVPFSLEEIDAAWLTHALRDSGVIEQQEVTHFTHRIIGEETGFLGEVAILTLEYSPPAPEAPSTMVLKIPTALKNRVMGQTIGVYEKEIRFYNQLKNVLKVRSPAHYYSALTAVDDPDVVVERLKGLQKLPVWLIAILSVIVRIVIGFMPRRYVLLIEDVSHFRLGDQLQGCSEDDVLNALDAMAKLHSQFWGTEELDRMSWIVPVDLTAKLMETANIHAVRKYRKSNADNLSDTQNRLLDWLEINGLRLTETLGRHPRTLLHGDFRLDNLCFDDTKGEVLLLDWQTMTSGCGGMDLAYFLSAALPIDAPAEKVSEVIEHYRQALIREGVEVTKDQLRWMYELGMLSMLQRIAPILFQEMLELGSDRGPELMQGWIDKTYKRLEDVDFEHILERVPEGV